MVNNAFILDHIDHVSFGSPSGQAPQRTRLSSTPCLPASLPKTAFMQREADAVAPNTLERQRAGRSLPPSPRDALFDALNSQLPEPLSESPVSPSSPTQSKISSGWNVLLKSKVKPARPWKTPQSFEIFSAIDKKDIMFLMEVRDRAFELLLRKAPNGTTPLLYAMQQGKSHQEIAIILVGAFSRFVNHLDDADYSKPKTKELLKALRTNLKLAIDYGLQSSQSDLISSFLQTLVMSGGERWVNDQVSNTASALRAGSLIRPVDTTRSAVRGFATKQLKGLGKGQTIASLDDYVANATGDLLMMAAWSSVMSSVDRSDPIPTWYFARDDRVYKSFAERVDRHKSVIQERCSKRLKWQLRILMDVMEGRTISWRSKLDVLESTLDNPDESPSNT